MLHAFGKGEGETCAACFSGRYPVPFVAAQEQQPLFGEDDVLSPAGGGGKR
jgi:hypothetical protein